MHFAYLTHHVGNRLDRAKAEAFVDSAPAMLDRFEREGIAAFTLALTRADYHPTNPVPHRAVAHWGRTNMMAGRLARGSPSCALRSRP